MTATFYWRDPAAPTPNQPRSLGTIAVITDDEGRVLMERRSDCGRWGLVAGAAADDESALEALRREVREETGCELATSDFLGVFTDPSRVCAYPDGNVVSVVSVVYLGTLGPGEPVASAESLELRWVPWHDLDDLDVVETMIPVLAAARRRLRDPAYVHAD